MSIPTKVVYGESGLLYIRSYLECIAREQEKYRDIFSLLESSLAQIVLISAHLCTTCSRKFGRFWIEIQENLENAHLLFMESQNPFQKTPIIADIRDNDFQLKYKFMTEDLYPSTYNPNPTQNNENNYNIFDANFYNKNYNYTHYQNSSDFGGRHSSMAPSPVPSYCPSIPDVFSHRRVSNTDMSLASLSPPRTPSLRSPAQRASSFPKSGHTYSIPSPYGASDSTVEIPILQAPGVPQMPDHTLKDVPLGIPTTPEHHGPFPDSKPGFNVPTTTAVVKDLVKSLGRQYEDYLDVPSSIVRILLAAEEPALSSSTTDSTNLPPPPSLTPTQMSSKSESSSTSSSSSSDEEATRNTILRYMRQLYTSRGIPVDPTIPAVTRKPGHTDSESDDDDSVIDISHVYTKVLKRWKAMPSPSNNDASDDIIIEKEILHPKTIDLAYPIVDVRALAPYLRGSPAPSSVTESISPSYSPSPAPSAVAKTVSDHHNSVEQVERDNLSNIFDKLQKFSERRNQNKEPELEEEEDDADSDYRPTPSRYCHKSTSDINGKGRTTGRGARKNSVKRALPGAPVTTAAPKAARKKRKQKVSTGNKKKK